MKHEYTSTNKTDEMPGLTVEAILEAREQIGRIIYYRTSELMPVVDPDGDPLVLYLSERPIDFNEFSLTPARREAMIVHIHPDNELPFLQAANELGYMALEVDWIASVGNENR